MTACCKLAPSSHASIRATATPSILVRIDTSQFIALSECSANDNANSSVSVFNNSTNCTRFLASTIPRMHTAIKAIISMDCARMADEKSNRIFSLRSIPIPLKRGPESITGNTTYEDPKKLSEVLPSRRLNSKRSSSSLLSRSRVRRDRTISFQAFEKACHESETDFAHIAVDALDAGSGEIFTVETLEAKISTVSGIVNTLVDQLSKLPIFLYRWKELTIPSAVM
mmetsp:Transcript_8659/g.32244  ORF Transcript_8659/g.32244 Transcript_8659/m.32244 type:complete len:226 (-) Transcript_8659:4287-4964(-)